MAVALTTAMGTASAGYNSNGIFGFNPYSFMTPSWFVEEFDNFVDEFDNDNSYCYIRTDRRKYQVNIRRH